MSGWGTPDHDHTDFAGRGDLEYEADERKRLEDAVSLLNRQIVETGELIRDLQYRIEQLEATGTK